MRGSIILLCCEGVFQDVVQFVLPLTKVNISMLTATVFVQALLCGVLTSTAFGLALPSARDRLEKRMHNRRERQSLPGRSNTTHLQYNTNWSGVILNAPAVRY